MEAFINVDIPVCLRHVICQVAHCKCCMYYYCMYCVCVPPDQSTQTGSGYSPLARNDKASSYFEKALKAEKELESSENDDINVTDLSIAQLTVDTTTVSEELSPIVATTAITTTHDHAATLLEDHTSSEGHVASSNDDDNVTEPRPHPTSHLTTPTRYISTSLPSPNSDEWIAVQKKKKKSKDEGSAGKVQKNKF